MSEKRTAATGEVITNFLRTLFAPVWLPAWCLGWLLLCLDDEVAPTFWPPLEQHYLMRKCGHVLDTYQEAQVHRCEVPPAMTPRTDAALPRKDAALAALRALDAEASPGPWEAGETEWGLGAMLEVAVDLASDDDILVATSETAKRAEANARLASLSKGHLLRAMEALGTGPCTCRQPRFGQPKCQRCAVLAAFENATLGPEAKPDA